MVVGLQGSGKTTLIKHLAGKTRRHLIYDPLQEYLGYNRYLPTDRYSVEELDNFILGRVLKWRPRLFVIDEMNKYAKPHPSRLPKGIADLNDFSRHYGLTWGGAFRRPSQVHPDMMELAHFIFAFGLRGRNDRKFFDAHTKGLGDVVANLEEFHFVVIPENGQWFIHNPVPFVTRPNFAP